MRKSGLRDKTAGGSQNAASFRAVDFEWHSFILVGRAPSAAFQKFPFTDLEDAGSLRAYPFSH
jgi:hypothetical protein